MNYHGPYTLTRLLEPVLLASKPSRVVNVASVEHRVGYIMDIKKFMFDGKQFLYSATKLGNVLFTYEHQRRLGALGIQVELHVMLIGMPCCCQCVWLHSFFAESEFSSCLCFPKSRFARTYLIEKVSPGNDAGCNSVSLSALFPPWQRECLLCTVFESVGFLG